MVKRQNAETTQMHECTRCKSVMVAVVNTHTALGGKTQAEVAKRKRAQNEKTRLFPSFCYKIPVTNRFFSGFSKVLRITIDAP